MSQITIHCPYKTTTAPWGGANNFLRALQGELTARHNILFTEDAAQSCDLLFFNELGDGPGGQLRHFSIEEVEAMRRLHPNAKMIVRAINLRRHSFPKSWPFYQLRGDRAKDRNTLTLLHMADHVIFQSRYQHGFFVQAGYRGKSYDIIHNGANAVFLDLITHAPVLEDSERLRIFSSSISVRATKRHDLIAKISQIPGTEVHYAGPWPKKMDAANIIFHGILTHEQMTEQLKQAHFFLHPAVKDPCPNSMIEALCAGRPVLYNNGPGSGSELAGSYGVAIDEKDIEGTIRIARSSYSEIVEALELRRADFSIRRAAEDYVAVFRKILLERTELPLYSEVIR